MQLAVIAYPGVALFTLIKSVLYRVKSECVRMINLAIIANTKVVFTTMTLKDILKLYTVGAVILTAFDTSYLL